MPYLFFTLFISVIVAVFAVQNAVSVSLNFAVWTMQTNLVIVILGSCVFRVIWVYTVFAWLGTITSLYLLYIFSWAITGAAEIVYFRRSYQKVILSAQSW